MRNRITEKKERALGTKLFLKPFRSQSPKAASVRRPNKPGIHGAKRSRAASEFKQQLMEKQKVRVSYGLTEKQMKSLVGKAFEKSHTNSVAVPAFIMQNLESRLDNVVYRMGFAPSRAVGRQIVNHGLVLVNDRKTNIPSALVRIGDKIAIKETKKNSPLFKELPNTLKANTQPAWLSVDPATLVGTMKAHPAEVELPFNINLVIDYYSR